MIPSVEIWYIRVLIDGIHTYILSYVRGGMNQFFRAEKNFACFLCWTDTTKASVASAYFCSCGALTLNRCSDLNKRFPKIDDFARAVVYCTSLMVILHSTQVMCGCTDMYIICLLTYIRTCSNVCKFIM